MSNANDTSLIFTSLATVTDDAFSLMFKPSGETDPFAKFTDLFLTRVGKPRMNSTGLTISVKLPLLSVPNMLEKPTCEIWDEAERSCVKKPN